MDFHEVLQRRARGHVCTAAVIVRKGKVLLGNRIYPEKALSVWNFPGGRCNKGETIERAIKREIFEEIGVESQKVNIIDFIGEIKGSWKDDIVLLFYCTIEGEPILMEPDKFRKWVWFKFEDVPKTHYDSNAMSMIKKYMRDKDHEHLYSF